MVVATSVGRRFARAIWHEAHSGGLQVRVAGFLGTMHGSMTVGFSVFIVERRSSTVRGRIRCWRCANPRCPSLKCHRSKSFCAAVIFWLVSSSTERPTMFLWRLQEEHGMLDATPSPKSVGRQPPGLQGVLARATGRFERGSMGHWKRE